MSEMASCSFNEPFVLRLKGALDLYNMRRAIYETMSRHESFRLQFSNDGAYQAFGKLVLPEIHVEDVSSLSAEEQARRVYEVGETAATTPFALDRDEWVRIAVLKHSADDYSFVFSGHHIVLDGWSWNIFLEDVAAAYGAFQSGQRPTWEDAASYKAYVLQEIEEQASEEIAEAYEYWTELFAELPPALDLPTDRPRPALKSYSGGSVNYHFRDEVYKAIKQTAQKEGASLFGMLFASFNLLLSHLSGNEDIVVTVPTAGQVKVGEDALIGHCVNLLPVRSRIDYEGTFDSFLANTGAAVLDAYDHQECTLGGIIKRLDMPRNASRMPLAEVNFNLDRDGAGLEFAGLEFGLKQVDRCAVNFDMFFNLNETPHGLIVDCDYNTDLFDDETIVRWIEHFEGLLVEIAKNPHRPVKELQVIASAERQQVVYNWNETVVEYPSDKSVYHLLEEKAAATPEATAIITPELTLSYAELNGRANRLARYLRQQGVAQGDYVGISLHRTELMVIGLLGIMKAGGAYVPMDPAFPESRLAYMAENSGLELIITETDLLEELPVDGQELIVLDRDWDVIAEQAADNPEFAFDPEQLAYVIYTSGSTGKPKGVQIPHRALTNFLCTMQEKPGLTTDDLIVNVTTLSFDIAALEIYLPLITGARLLLLDQMVAADGFALAEALDQYEVTVMQATPATWQMMLEAGWAGKANLKMLSGGERLPEKLAQELLGKGGELWNMYGPTETTIWSSVQQIQPDDELITIGRPIANTQMYVLNDYMQPVGVGVIGLLYIGGDGLAQGYLNRPELTEKRFVDNPFGAGKIYNTGDRARFLPDGQIECLGRVDYQVKVRGYRIELGEIEAVLAQHPAVQSCVVIVREDVAGDKRLAAYIVVNNGFAPTDQELRDHMRQQLPDYMVPSNFMLLEALPLTPNGKINRLQLPAPTATAAAAGQEFVGPRTETEQVVAAVWAEVLDMPQVGVFDGFFALGGHSLLAVRVVSKLREQFGLSLQMNILFELSTVAALSEHIETLQYALTAAENTSNDEDEDWEEFEF